MSESFRFQFGSFTSTVNFREKITPAADFTDDLFTLLGYNISTPALVVCDKNTASFARNIFDRIIVNSGAEKNGKKIQFFELPSGEQTKNWSSTEAIICSAKKTGLGRDGLFIGVGGGVVCDLTAFAASIYMRGAFLSLIPTTLLGMVDAALGGKTGINLDGIKNLTGTFYPAGNIVIAAEALATLPPEEWKNGIAELIKTAIVDPDETFFNEMLQMTASLKSSRPEAMNTLSAEEFLPFIKKAVLTKGRIVENDPTEKINNQGGRALLNLGHSFGHALESVFPLSHGRAIAWGIAKASELGLALGITPPNRAGRILQILSAWGFDTSNNILGKIKDENAGKNFYKALLSDKKKKAGHLHFVVPSGNGAMLVEENDCITDFIHSL